MSNERVQSNDTPSIPYTFTEADIEARSVLEQQIQSFASCYSMIMQVLKGQDELKNCIGDADYATRKVEQRNAPLFPLEALSVSNAIDRVWNVMETIPKLLEKYIVQFYTAKVKASKTEQPTLLSHAAETKQKENVDSSASC